MGFPWHPHRSIETITCMLRRTVLHAESVGNQGTIFPEI
jgi:redox-sensitive bicupin YhaK (pirin superfamily)